MKTRNVSSSRYEFYFPELDNHVLVETRDEVPVIRATRDNFPERRKRGFIRRLAAEGHIPDQYQWFCGTNLDGYLCVQWVIDCSWLKIDAAVRQRAQRNVLRLILCSGVFWLLLLGMVLACCHH